MERSGISHDFYMRKLHSIMGFGLLLFLVEHLLTNSESALMVGKDGSGFIQMVNFIHSLPYLKVLEVLLIGIPLLIHMVYGVIYLRSGRSNVWDAKGNKPSLAYEKNVRYSLQRLTSWFLLVAILLHVLQMRFLEAPTEVFLGTKSQSKYLVHLEMDKGLYTLSKRLGIQLFDQNKVDSLSKKAIVTGELSLDALPEGIIPYQEEIDKQLSRQERQRLTQKWVEALNGFSLQEGQVVASAPNVGSAFLLKVRETFKDPVARVLYSIFVLAAVFHACNGLWTFLISWGVTLNSRSQAWASTLSYGLMAMLSFLGLVSIWGTYLINLRA